MDQPQSINTFQYFIIPKNKIKKQKIQLLNITLIIHSQIFHQTKI